MIPQGYVMMFWIVLGALGGVQQHFMSEQAATWKTTLVMKIKSQIGRENERLGSFCLQCASAQSDQQIQVRSSDRSLIRLAERPAVRSPAGSLVIIRAWFGLGHFQRIRKIPFISKPFKFILELTESSKFAEYELLTRPFAHITLQVLDKIKKTEF